MTLGVEGQAGETPKEGDPVFRAIDTRLVGTNREALLASAEKAAELGFKPILLSSMITGEARETAKFYAALAKEAARYPSASAKPVCYIGGGETTVTLKGKGTGGRNQEMALSFLNEFADEPDLLRGVCFLSAGTDGNDGPTDAAGAFASSELLALGRKAGLNTRAFLSENNSYGYFSPIGGLLMTGPTNTNVCDIHLMIVT